MPHLSLSLLGPLHIVLDGAPVTAFESDKVRALLVYLAVEAGRPHRRGALAGLLWPDRPERTALLNLNQALANLRRALGDRSAQVPLILSTRDAIQLNPAAGCALDVGSFLALLAACEAHAHRNPQSCAACAQRRAEAAVLYRGAFLEQFAPRDSALFQEWVVVMRERLQRQVLQALDWLAAYYERRGDAAAALQAAYRLVELDPWREEAHRQVMRLLWQTGQRGAALAQYERCRAALDAELGIEPEEETIALYEQIRSQSTDTPVSRPASTAQAASGQGAQPEAHSATLPTQATPFVGREAELAQLADYLADPACRLITIVGLGGSGKTRLALEAATEQQSAFAGGARFVPLAAARAADMLLPAIAAALGLGLSGSEGALEQIARHLRDIELLLLLDNLEQLRDGVAALGPLLERAPRLTILATSRERLRLRGEWVLELGGLSIPPDDAPESFERSSAATLFMQVARRTRGQFAPDEAERRAIVQICRALAGHPLGIELAASWAHALSCAEIAAELARSLELLASDAPDQPERHRTIQAVFDSSWHLLAEPERMALRQLSAFRGGFDREAAAAVCAQASGVGHTPNPQPAMLQLLSTLIGKSLLARVADGRYTMHELVRQYAGEQLRRAGEAEQAWGRHGAYFLGLVEQAEPYLKGADEAIWFDRLSTEHDNLRAALDRALASGAVELAARMCVVLRWLWYVRGYIAEGRQWIERTLAAASASPAQLPPRLRARLLQGAGVLADEQAEYAVAAARYAEAIALYREIDDIKGIQATTNSLGMLAWARGDYAQAQGCFEESLRLSRQLGHTFGIANSLNGLGTTIQAQGDGPQALVLYEEALATAHVLQYDMLITMILDNIGEVALAQGDIARSHAVYTEALARQQRLGDTRGAALSRQGLGLIALTQGDLAAAQQHLSEGLATSWQSASQRELAAYIDNIAALLVAQGQAVRAARLIGATAAFRERSGTPLTPFERPAYERTRAAARAALDDATFGLAWVAGQAMPLEQVVGEVVELA